jgi:uroporphyrinogen-III synthase
MDTKRIFHILFLNKIETKYYNSNVVRISCVPLINTEKLQFDNVSLNKNVPWIFTSKIAVSCFKPHELPQKIYAIGEKTAEGLRPHVKEILIPETPTSRDLGTLILENNEKELYFICGNKRRPDLKNILEEEGLIFHEKIVYETKPSQADVDLEGVDGLVFMSSSSVVQMAKKGGFNNLPCFAIGPTTGMELSRNGVNAIVSESATVESLIDAVDTYFHELSKE